MANSGDLKKAEKYFKHCIRLQEKSIPAHFGLGKILHSFNDYKQALLHLKYVIENDKDNYKALCQIGLIYIEKKPHNYEMAGGYISKCLKIKPDYIPGLIAMGNVMFETGETENAQKYFE